MDVVEAKEPVTVDAGRADRMSSHAIGSLLAADVYDSLSTRPTGLTSDEARRRLEVDGPNLLEEVRRPHLLRSFLSNVTHLMAVMLWAGCWPCLPNCRCSPSPCGR